MRCEYAISNLMRESCPALRVRLIAAARRLGNDMSADDAEDAIQDAFMLLYEDWEEYKDRENLPGFLYITALHNLQNKHRVNQERAQIVVASTDADNGGMDCAAARFWEETESQARELENRRAMLEQIKNCVNETDYSFLLNYYDDGITAKKIAAQYDVTEESVWKRKERLIKRILRSMYKATTHTNQ